MTIMSNIFSRANGAAQIATPHTEAPAATTMPLAMATAGQLLQLVDIQAGHKLTLRLAEMGLTRGVTLQVVQDGGGPLLVAVRGSRVAIGRGMAHKIQVKPI